MKRIRAVAFTGLAVTFVVALAAPAFAHEEINPKVVTTGSPVFLTLTAANEAQSDLTKVVLTAPKGYPFGTATRSPSGWSVTKSDTTITWSGGKVAPDAFENFGFELDDVPQPGTLAFGVALTAGAAPEQVTVNIEAVAPGSATTTPGSSGGTTTTVSTEPAPPPTIPASVTSSVNQAKSRSNTAAILGVVGVVLGVIAIILAIVLRRNKRPAGAHSPGQAQDF
jgi:uncharacterized protein YcnI